MFYIILYLTFLFGQIIIIDIFISPYINCNDWHKGLNNTIIENNNKKYSCQIRFPKFCLYLLGKNFLDMTKITGFECNKKITKNKLLEKSKSPFINNFTKRIGFPLTSKNPIFFKDYFQEFLVDMVVFLILL